MEVWQIGAAANGLVALAYLMICRAIVIPLAQGGELRSNKLGAATSLIFFTCAVHHGSHAVHMLLPYAGVATDRGLAMREAFDMWPVAWDIITAAVGVYYWTLRRSYGRLLDGSKLFEDYRQRQREALEINDTVVQGLVVAQLALAAGRTEDLRVALDGSLASARGLVDQILAAGPAHPQAQAGDFVRRTPATLPTPPP